MRLPIEDEGPREDGLLQDQGGKYRGKAIWFKDILTPCSVLDLGINRI